MMKYLQWMNSEDMINNMKIGLKKNIFVLVLLLAASCSSSKSVKIDVKDMDIGQFCDTAMFRGIRPDITYDELCAIAGEPNEFIDIKSYDEEDHNPTYYFEEGKVMCYWSGSKRDEMGVIVYTPYQNTHLKIDNVIYWPLEDYDINPKTERVHIYKGDTLFFVMDLENFEVKKIYYWLIDK